VQSRYGVIQVSMWSLFSFYYLYYVKYEFALIFDSLVHDFDILMYIIVRHSCLVTNIIYIFILEGTHQFSEGGCGTRLDLSRLSSKPVQ